MNIPKFSVNNPVLVNLTMIIIFLLGIYTIMTIPKEAMPQIDLGKFVITVAYPGVAPEEIETLIIDKIEEELADITDIDYISSTAYEGMASIMVNLLPSVDIDKAWNDIGTELDKVKDLPEDASDIQMKNLSMKELKTVCTVAIEGESYTPDALRRIADNIKDDISKVKYVSKVEMKGEKNREIQIDIDKNKLEYYGISFNDIENAIKSKNMNLPGGDIKSGKSEILIRTMGEFENLDQIRSLIIRSLSNGAVIRLRDIAEVVDTYEDVNILTRLNGKESINLYVYQNTDGNILDIVSKIRKYVKTIPGKYTDIKAEIVNDASLEVKSNISTLSSSAVLGIFLVFLTLFIFIGWRNAIFAAMGIPFSFLMTFWIMNFFGITINNLSLFALVLILGMVVDDAIVVIENVHRNIEEGMTPKEAAIKGTQEVMWPVIAAVLTTISAFLPILMMEGNMGKFLSEFPKVVMIALAASLFEALFILPSHLADFSKAHDAKAKHKTKNGFYSKLVNKYSIVLKGFLKKRLLSLTILSIVFVISVSTVVLGFVKFEFFPSSTPKTLVIQVKTLPGNSLAQTDSLTYLLEKKILGLEYKRNFETLNSNIGQMQERRNWEESSNYVELRLDLIDADSLTVEVSTIRKDIREYLETIPEVMSYKFSTEAHGPPTGNDVELRVLGDDLAKLQEHSNKIKKVLSGIEGVTDIEDSFDAGKKEMRIYPDYDKLAINGMTVAELAGFIRIASTGKVVSEFTERSDKYDIRIKLRNDQFENVQDVENLKITTRIGKKIYLKDIVRFEINTSLSQIEHRDGRRMIEITANSGMYSDNGKMKKRTPSEINQILFGNKVRNVKGELSSFEKDNSGYTIDVGGASDQKKKSFNSLYLAFLVAVILIYMILGTQFKSYIQPIIVMVTIPFAFIGVIAGLFFTGTPFSLLSLIAVLALAGIVVNDSIVLVDFINKEREKGVDRWNSLINAGKTRLRPILLTSITTIFGLVPMMISTSESVAMWKPMAVSISFGLAFATVLTLLVLPVVYSLVDSMTCVIKRKKGITLKEALEIRIEKGYDN